MAEIVKMPALSDTMTSGTLVAWHVKVGDAVASGDLLAEIETDKAVMEFQSLYDGFLLYTGVAEGAAVPVDTIIAIIGEKGEDVQALLAGNTAKAPAVANTIDADLKEMQALADTIKTGEAELAKVQTLLDSIVTPVDSDERVKASPLAKAIAKEQGIDINAIKGSGDEGRIVRKDVENFLQQQQTKPQQQPATETPATIPAPAPQGEYEDVMTSQMRKTIARRLSESKFSAPHFYLTMEINMDNCMAMRTQINALSETKISFNDFVVKAAAKALTLNPNVNASWLGDRIRYYKYVNVGVAVAMDEGLVVPVIRNTETKSLSQIAQEVRVMAAKAKDRKIQPADMQGNTFTISNLGMFGIDEFTAIINPPDACILAVGRIAPKLVLVGGEVKETNVMKVTLSCDHRVVDGASGAKFLQSLRDILEQPLLLIV
jgi:pyruvate dehydrogenase E2 component (dihydrolipoamide acetyltransferase)